MGPVCEMVLHRNLYRYNSEQLIAEKEEARITLDKCLIYCLSTRMNDDTVVKVKEPDIVKLVSQRNCMGIVWSSEVKIF